MAENKIEFELDPAVAEGMYSNFVIIAHSPSEVILDFASALPGMPKARVGSRIILTPEHAKRLLLSLQENLGNYESKFGTINVGQGNGFNPKGRA